MKNNEMKVNEVETVEIEEVGSELEKLDLDLEQNDDENLFRSVSRAEKHYGIDWKSFKVSASGLMARKAMSLVMRTTRDMILDVHREGLRVIIGSESLLGFNPKTRVERIEKILKRDEDPDLTLIGIRPGEDEWVALRAVPMDRVDEDELRPHQFMESWRECQDSKFICLADGTDPIRKTEKILLNRVLTELGVQSFLNDGTDWGWNPFFAEGERCPFKEDRECIWEMGK